uniref:NADH-ubiquinone oxidoreductase chain 4 n=1 Tax=Allobates aff. melanolaemusi AR-2020 TaxID=2772349 RepID=A0A7M4CGD2_9NEOB|nr:NADH dehydrogenase subunit 4 [Allobates aff. melanolaemusi AR-2020]
MLIIALPLLINLFSSWALPVKQLWELTTTLSLATATLSTMWFFSHKTLCLTTPYLLIDEISSPLLILTCWLTAPTILASQSKISKEPISRQRTYIFTIIMLQTTTLLAFMANNLILFFIMFEATMIPTLILITRWGAQKERMMAGTYLLFYTLSGSMALLTALLFFHENIGTLSFTLLKEISTQLYSLPFAPTWWLACFLAFLIKMPLYGVHLWLPKAHVEAPIAGSMILAGTLLKLGGYGILRMGSMMGDSLMFMAAPLITFSLFGVFLSAILCSRQTDLKSLIAFSSVSHMGLVIAASMIKTDWSIAGAMILMISHGLVSSALFCLANTIYERTNTRTLVLLQGSQIIFPLAAAWWLMASLLNMALPPFSSFMGELSILLSLFQWSYLTLLISALSIIFTTSYSLYLFWSSQREHLPPHTNTLFPTQGREHILLALHILPIILISTNPSLMF